MMMWKEFEELAGYEVTFEDYTNIIEPMYNATELSKLDFIKCIDKKRFALPTKKQMVNKMRKIAEHLKETCEHDSDYESEHELEDLAWKYGKRFYGLNRMNINHYVYIDKEYTYKEIMRGCRYPYKITFGTDRYTYEILIIA